jgi:hypothetical protein
MNSARIFVTIIFLRQTKARRKKRQKKDIGYKTILEDLKIGSLKCA